MDVSFSASSRQTAPFLRPAFPRRRAMTLAALAAGLALAGCDGMSALGSRSRAVPVVEMSEDCATIQANVASVSEVIQRNPNDPQGYNTRGAAYARCGRFQEAITDFGNALRADPAFYTAYLNRGLAYRQLGRTELALADFNRAIEMNPRHAPA